MRDATSRDLVDGLVYHESVAHSVRQPEIEDGSRRAGAYSPHEVDMASDVCRTE
jgi:hypothetical protein